LEGAFSTWWNARAGPIGRSAQVRPRLFQLFQLRFQAGDDAAVVQGAADGRAFVEPLQLMAEDGHGVVDLVAQGLSDSDMGRA